MLFNSLTFLIFFVAVVFLYYVLPYKYSRIMLFFASCIFYMWWNPIFIFLIMGVTAINYLSAIFIEKYKKQKKFILALVMLFNFGQLIFFKYLNFFSNCITYMLSLVKIETCIPEFSVILPMGISFFTFQAASYTIDVYTGKYPAEKSFFKVALFITFFPQLVAGPIERADRLLKRLFEKHSFKLSNLSEGIKLMLMGYFKKVVISDRASILVDAVYNSPTDYKGLSLIIATLFFTVQIYCDFSGYTDIAIGCARVMDIDLMKNFDRPYFATSIKDFWRRWHISLSTWFRDYLYIPLGGSRCSVLRKYFNILVTFFVSGLWHGANITFVLWGGLHGIYQIIGDIKDKYILKGRKIDALVPLKIIITFCLVSFAWIFFRANSLSDATYIIKNLFSDIASYGDLQYVYEVLRGFSLKTYEMLILVYACVFLFFSDMISFKYDIHTLLKKTGFPIRFAYYYVLIIFILAGGVFTNGGQFIYFQF